MQSKVLRPPLSFTVLAIRFVGLSLDRPRHCREHGDLKIRNSASLALCSQEAPRRQHHQPEEEAQRDVEALHEHVGEFSSIFVVI